MKFIIYFCIFFCISAYANQTISLDLENVQLSRAIEMLAQYTQQNVIVSPAIHDVVSLHLKNIALEDALSTLLLAHELQKWQVNGAWFIGTEKEMLKHNEDLLKNKKFHDETDLLYTQVWQIHYAKVADVQNLIANSKNSILSKRGFVSFDVRTNILYVHDTKEHLQDVSYLIKRLDIPVQQILIEVHLASVDSDYERTLGVNFSSSESGLAIARLKNNILLNVQLAALEKEGHGEVLSNPSLFTANLEAASIESGEEIPYQEISKSGASGVAFKKAVLSLEVLPQIMPGKQILLQIKVNQDKPNKRIVLGVPSITTRQMHTNIRVKSGQTIVLGGIYESNKEQDLQGIPFLGKIPLVGWLFHQQNVTNTKRELLIFVTPKIIIG
jgi:type IV pilus assembly protein PilQ